MVAMLVECLVERWVVLSEVTMVVLSVDRMVASMVVNSVEQWVELRAASWVALLVYLKAE